MTRFDSKTDVLVIGGGFCGIGAARLLNAAAIETIIVEKRATIGKKSTTVYFEGNVIETGTCFLGNDYGEIKKLAREFDIALKPMGGTSSAAPDSILQGVYVKGIVELISKAPSVSRLLAAALRYSRRRAQTLEGFDRREAESLKEAAAPVSTWLEANGLVELAPIFLGIGDLYGYGPSSQVPALYMLRWVTPQMVATTLTRSGLMLERGFGVLLANLAQGLDIRPSRNVSSASFDEQAGRWAVQTDAGEITAKAIVVACPPNNEALRCFFDAARWDVFSSSIRQTPYASVIVTADRWFSVDRRALLRAGDLYDRVMVARNDGPFRGSARYYACFVCPTSFNREHIERIVRRDIAADGGELLEIVHIGEFSDFNSHFSSDAIASGRYHRVEELQGDRNVWVSNSVLAHENWRDLYTLNKRISADIVRFLRPASTVN